MTMQRHITRLDLLQSDIASLESVGTPSLEAIGIFSKIADLFTRVLYNLRAETLHVFKDFRRSELRTLHESRNLQVKDLLNTREVLPLHRVTIPIPTGMKVPYTKAVGTLGDLFAELRIEETVKALETCFQKLDTLTPERYDTIAFDAIAHSIDKLQKAKLERGLQEVFAKDGPGEVMANTVILKQSELAAIDARILTYDETFQHAARLVKRIKAIEDTVGRMIDRLESYDGKINPAVLRNLEGLIRTAASQFDYYGVILHEMLRVEHNFVLTLRRLFDYA